VRAALGGAIDPVVVLHQALVLCTLVDRFAEIALLRVGLVQVFLGEAQGREQDRQDDQAVESGGAHGAFSAGWG